MATEHAAVLDTAEWLEGKGIEVVRLRVGAEGLIDLDLAEALIDDKTAMVAVMLVNNEIGVIQPIAELTQMAHRVGALMLCDAVQGFGRLPVPDGPDLIAISGHKIHGPKGIGGLWMRAGSEPEPLLHGGGQEQGLRSGTLAPALCVGMGEAGAIGRGTARSGFLHIERLAEIALATFGRGWIINGSPDQRYRGNLNLRRDMLDGARLISDCAISHFRWGRPAPAARAVRAMCLRAIGLTDREARSSIRLGFGRYTTERKIVSACRRHQ